MRCCRKKFTFAISSPDEFLLVTSNGSPYAIRPLSCLSCRSVTLVYCGQTVRWIKTKLGTEVGLCPGHTVLDGDPALPKGAQSPNFWPMSIVAKRSPISATAEHLFYYSFCLLVPCGRLKLGYLSALIGARKYCLSYRIVFRFLLV